jgi:hypothetical protein
MVIDALVLKLAAQIYKLKHQRNTYLIEFNSI